jgi:hypothetical protein
MGSKSKTPPPPDYTAAANQQAQQAKENLAQQTWANRPEQITPWGKESWTQTVETDPLTGAKVPKWTQTTTLDPALEAALKDQLGIQSERSDIAQGMLGQIRESFGTPFDWSSLPSAPAGAAEQAQEQAYARMQALGAPERAHSRQELTRSLANQGITPGSPQYERAMRMQAQGEGAQDLQQMLSAGAEGRAMGGYQQGLRANAIAEQMQRRGMSLNELNALLTGQQVQMPGMPGFQGAGVAETPNLLGAAQGQYGAAADAYNAKQGQKAQTMQTIGTIAGIAGMAVF